MGKRFRELTQTATDADFAEGNYFGVDTPSVTKKLPANLVAKASDVEVLGKETAAACSLLTGSFYAVKNDPSGEISAEYRGGVASVSLSRSTTSIRVGVLARTSLRDIVNKVNKLYFVVENVGQSAATFGLMLVNSQNDWSSSIIVPIDITINAGAIRTIVVDVTPSIIASATDVINVAVVLRTDSQSNDLDVRFSFFSDLQDVNYVSNAFRSLLAQSAENAQTARVAQTSKAASSTGVGKNIPYTSSTLNGATVETDENGIVTFTRGTGLAAFKLRNINPYIDAHKKLVFCAREVPYVANAYKLNRLVITPGDNWSVVTKNLIADNPDVFHVDGGGQVVIDFDSIPNLDTSENTYYLIWGTDSAGEVTTPIQFGLFELDEGFVAPPNFTPKVIGYAETAGQAQTAQVAQTSKSASSTGVGANIPFSLSASNPNGATYSTDTNGLTLFTKGTGFAKFSFGRVNDYIDAHKKLVFCAREVPHVANANKIDKLVLSTANNWGTVNYNFLSDDPNLFHVDGGGQIVIDFDAIPNLDTSSNNYSLVCGSNEAGEVTTPIQFGLFEFDEGFVAQPNFTPKEAKKDQYIACWGSSGTQMGRWTTVLSNKSGLTLRNCGVGGEGSNTIMARQGGDVMIVNNVTIPAAATAVVIAGNKIDTELGNQVTPARQTGGQLNPVSIAEVEGNLVYDSDNSQYKFTRLEAGEAVVIDRPTAMLTKSDRMWNAPYLMTILMGANGGYDNDFSELIKQHDRMIAHAHADNVLILEMTRGNDETLGEYNRMATEHYGRYFVSIRKYLAGPIYAQDGVTITSSYGLDDAGLTPTADDLEAIAAGAIPPQLLMPDGVHYTDACATVIGNFLFRKCQELGIF